MKILFTGASSFTGAAFAEHLARSGHEVIAPLLGSSDHYEGVRLERINLLKNTVDLRWSIPFGSERFSDLAKDVGADLFCHHAARVTDYRSPDFDVVAALANNAGGIKSLLEILKASGLLGVVITGSVFEENEGAGSRPLSAFSPYGLSKTLTAQVLRYWCRFFEIPCGKFVIPNPFGPFEEPRFCAYLYKTWKNGRIPRVNTPDYVRDNIHIDLLACCYEQFCREVVHVERDYLHSAPSGYIETQGSFSRRMAREIAPRLGLSCEVEDAIQTDRSEPMIRINLDCAVDIVPNWNEARAWDSYARYLASVSV